MDARIESTRAQPATEKQKEKLAWFGCTWDEGISRGQASDALDECAKQFPEKNQQYYDRPATDEQIKILRSYCEKHGEEPEDYAEGDYLTYREAKHSIIDWKEKVLMDEIESFNSEEALKGEIQMRLDDSVYRNLTPEEFDTVWELAKTRLTDMSDEAQKTKEFWRGIFQCLEELFPKL